MKILPVSLLVVAALALGGCAPEPVATPEPTVSSTPSPTPSAETSTPTPTSTIVSGWSECPGIVSRLNDSAPDGTTYVEIEPEAFDVQAVGAAALTKACVVDVVVSGEPVTWAIIPGARSISDEVVRELLGDGFASKGGGVYANNLTGHGVLVKFYGTGATLDEALKLPRVFGDHKTSLVFMSTYIIS